MEERADDLVDKNAFNSLFKSPFKPVHDNFNVLKLHYSPHRVVAALVSIWFVYAACCSLAVSRDALEHMLSCDAMPCHHAMPSR